MTTTALVEARVDDDLPWWEDARDDGSRPSMMTMIDLLAVDPDRLDADGAIDFLTDLQKHLSWLASLEARALVAAMSPHAVERRVEFAHRDPSVPPQAVTLVDEVRDELAAALHRSAPVVHDQVEHARLLHGPMRRTRDAMADGLLGVEQAKAILRRAARMSGRRVTTCQAPHEDTPAERAERAAYADRCEALQDRLLVRAAASTSAQVGAMAERALHSIDSAGAGARRDAARTEVDVTIRPDSDGMALLFARLDMTDAARLAAAIHARAADSSLPAPCGATAGQRRVAALLDLTCGRPNADDASGRAPVEVTTHIDVVVDLATLLGLSDEPGMLNGPGCDGGVPVAAGAIRELLADPSVGTTIRRLVTEPLTGHLLDRGRRTYAVPDDLRAFIATRDGTCRFPGCRRRAAACQMDHARPWEHGGRTDRDNCGPLCVRHHLVKTHSGWAIVDCGSDGSCTWRSPLGRRYAVSSGGPLGPPGGASDSDPPEPLPF